MRERPARESASIPAARHPQRDDDGADAPDDGDAEDVPLAPVGPASLADVSPSQSQPAFLRSAQRSIVEPSGRVATNWIATAVAEASMKWRVDSYLREVASAFFTR